MGDPAVANVTARAAAVVGLDASHAEPLQILKYAVGKKYGAHADCLAEQVQMPCGLRAYTMLLYLNDVAGGGATRFTELGLSVTPRKGTAILWGNVDDADPLRTCDDRTYHEALPVTAGVKYAANVWLHTRDFITPYQHGCTG